MAILNLVNQIDIAPIGRIRGRIKSVRTEAGKDGDGNQFNDLKVVVELDATGPDGHKYELERKYNLLGRGLAAFRNDYRSAFGKKLTDKELASFDTTLMEGQTVTMVVKHRKDGKEFVAGIDEFLPAVDKGSGVQIPQDNRVDDKTMAARIARFESEHPNLFREFEELQTNSTIFNIPSTLALAASISEAFHIKHGSLQNVDLEAFRQILEDIMWHKRESGMVVCKTSERLFILRMIKSVTEPTSWSEEFKALSEAEKSDIQFTIVATLAVLAHVLSTTAAKRDLATLISWKTLQGTFRYSKPQKVEI